MGKKIRGEGARYKFQRLVIEDLTKVIYRVTDDSIEIADVWDTRQSPEELVKGLVSKRPSMAQKDKEKIDKKHNNMAQETLNGLLQYVIQTLSPEDKKWFTRQLIENVYEKEAKPFTWEEARERLSISREQFRQGKYLTHEELMHSQLKEAV